MNFFDSEGRLGNGDRRLYIFLILKGNVRQPDFSYIIYCKSNPAYIKLRPANLFFIIILFKAQLLWAYGNGPELIIYYDPDILTPVSSCRETEIAGFSATNHEQEPRAMQFSQLTATNTTCSTYIHFSPKEIRSAQTQLKPFSTREAKILLEGSKPKYSDTHLSPNDDYDTVAMSSSLSFSTKSPFLHLELPAPPVPRHRPRVWSERHRRLHAPDLFRRGSEGRLARRQRRGRTASFRGSPSCSTNRP